MCHKGYFRPFLQDKIWDIDTIRVNSNVVNDVYKSVSIIYVDHDIEKINYLLIFYFTIFFLYFLNKD